MFRSFTQITLFTPSGANSAWRSVALAALLGFLVQASGAQEPDNLQDLRAHALSLVNQSRSEHDLNALTLGDNLDAAAQNHADDMFERNYYAHSSPEGDTVQDRFTEAGGSRWELVAENIARCAQCSEAPDRAAVDRLHEGWMNSPGHRANILSEGLSRFGFGIVTDADQGLYAVQTFAGPGTPRGLEEGEEAHKVQTQEMTAILVDAINTARQDANIGLIAPNAALDTAAQMLLPQAIDDFALDGIGNVFEALDRSEQANWTQLLTLAGACGGCGIEPTRTDIQAFAQQWLDQANYRQSLLDPQVNAAGFVLRADHQGRKNALLILGASR